MSDKSRFQMEEPEHQHDYGMSFADLMTTVVGTFLILLMYFMFLSTSQTQEIIEKYEKSMQQVKESQKKVEDIVNIRQNVIDDLQKVFKDSKLDVTIDHETGAIRLNDKILFDYDSAEISPQGKAFLNNFIPKYIPVILNENTKKNISEVIIEGHTDNSGPYLYNLDLSERRALAVAKYILSDEMPNFKGKEDLRQYLTATGKSYSHLVYTNGNVDADSSRRVEFKFRLKEAEALGDIQKILTN